MPLKSGKSQKTVSENIRELTKANADKPAGKKRSREQIIAIAMAQKKRSR